MSKLRRHNGECGHKALQHFPSQKEERHGGPSKRRTREARGRRPPARGEGAALRRAEGILAPQPPERGRGHQEESTEARPERAEVSAGTLDVMFVSVAVLGALGCVYYYIRGVLNSDRLLSRAAAITAMVLGVTAVAYWWRAF
jgi:hypothetical protein